MTRPVIRPLAPLVCAVLLGVSALCPPPARAQSVQRITNGGFESGLTGWNTATNRLGTVTYDEDPGATPQGGFLAGNAGTGATGPFSSLPILGAQSGTGFALADMNTSGAHVLYQSFTLGTLLPTARRVSTFSFALSAYDWSGLTESTGTLDPNVTDFRTVTAGQRNQYARVDLLFGTFSTGASRFTTATTGGSAQVLRTLFSGADAESQGGNPSAPLYHNYSFDLSDNTQTAGDYIVRFALVDNSFPLVMAVDNVSFTTAEVPETGAGVLLLAGWAASFWVRRRR